MKYRMALNETLYNARDNKSEGIRIPGMKEFTFTSKLRRFNMLWIFYLDLYLPHFRQMAKFKQAYY